MKWRYETNKDFVSDMEMLSSGFGVSALSVCAAGVCGKQPAITGDFIEWARQCICSALLQNRLREYYWRLRSCDDVVNLVSAHRG